MAIQSRSNPRSVHIKSPRTNALGRNRPSRWGATAIPGAKPESREGSSCEIRTQLLSSKRGFGRAGVNAVKFQLVRRFLAWKATLAS